jgi:hypothetical protein
MIDERSPVKYLEASGNSLMDIFSEKLRNTTKDLREIGVSA